MSEESGRLDSKMCALLHVVQTALQRCFGSQLAESVVPVGQPQILRSIPGGG